MLKKIILSFAAAFLLFDAGNNIAGEVQRISLKDGWLIKSTTQIKAEGDAISTGEFIPDSWYPTSVPTTVLNALTNNGLYPDFRIGLNNFLIPDASDEFNEKHDLAKYSHLPDKRNPWQDPYWFRTEFSLPETSEGKHVWLNFCGINYKADVWLNGNKIADHKELIGIYLRFRLDITDYAQTGKNSLAVRIYPVDHPGIPDTQLDVFGKTRKSFKEIQKDVTFVMCVGYDCMPTVRDRDIGILQEAYIDVTGPVDIRNPFVITDLPLPETSPASLTISAELVNATRSVQKGVLKGIVMENRAAFEKNVELDPEETKDVVFSPEEYPQLVLDNPRLWWPKNYGEQNLYNLSLRFEVDGELSDEENETFGIREVSKELHEYNGAHGLRVYVNGEKIFSRGGWLQPEIQFNMNEKRMDAEVRYLTESNLNTVTFEDIPMPPDAFLYACDRYGLLFWNSFFSSFWVRPETNYPLDHDLLERCAVDIIKRYRNHPSLILYSCVGEGIPSKDIYETWRKNILELDKTRLFVPTVDVRYEVEWIKKDIPTGLNDAVEFHWSEPSEYYQKVRNGGDWMFNTEVSIASLPPIESLRKFLPDLFRSSVEKLYPFPLNKTWAHHGANFLYQHYDSAIRRIYGSPYKVWWKRVPYEHYPVEIEDYCMQGHLVTATQHKAWSEAVNHRMWDITSGVWQWKLNSCWPSVQWQIYDWYLRPTVSYYYYKLAFEPLHVQLSPLDSVVTVINHHLKPKENLEVNARVYDFDMKMRWEHNAKTNIKANTFKDIFSIPEIHELTPIYFVKLELKDVEGNVVSNNFYWLSTKSPVDYNEMKKLPLVKLNISYEIENKGKDEVAHVKVENPTDKLAFFIHLAVTKGLHGEEVLPVFWEDNYFSLLPGESKEVNAAFAAEDLGGALPFIKVGGWNVKSTFDCTNLKISKPKVKLKETFTVTATIENTFLDGSIIELCVDNEVVDSKLFWSRLDSEREIVFTISLSKPGHHEIKVGAKTASVYVNLK